MDNPIFTWLRTASTADIAAVCQVTPVSARMMRSSTRIPLRRADGSNAKPALSLVINHLREAGETITVDHILDAIETMTMNRI